MRQCQPSLVEIPCHTEFFCGLEERLAQACDTHDSCREIWERTIVVCTTSSLHATRGVAAKAHRGSVAECGTCAPGAERFAARCLSKGDADFDAQSAKQSPPGWRRLLRTLAQAQHVCGPICPQEGRVDCAAECDRRLEGTKYKSELARLALFTLIPVQCDTLTPYWRASRYMRHIVRLREASRPTRGCNNCQRHVTKTILSLRGRLGGFMHTLSALAGPSGSLCTQADMTHRTASPGSEGRQKHTQPFLSPWGSIGIRLQ